MTIEVALARRGRLDQREFLTGQRATPATARQRELLALHLHQLEQAVADLRPHADATLEAIDIGFVHREESIVVADRGDQRSHRVQQLAPQLALSDCIFDSLLERRVELSQSILGARSFDRFPSALGSLASQCDFIIGPATRLGLMHIESTAQPPAFDQRHRDAGARTDGA